MGEIKDSDMDAAMSVLSCGIAYMFMMTVNETKFDLRNKFLYLVFDLRMPWLTAVSRWD